MKKKQAINMAIIALREQGQKIAFDANLYRAGVHTITGYKRNETKLRIEEAIRMLEDMKNDF